MDGNDIIAVREVMEYALDKARSGKGPTLVEALTYRISDHTTADDASRYRDKAEVEDAKKKEPLIRIRKYLTEHRRLGSETGRQAVGGMRPTGGRGSASYIRMPASQPVADHVRRHVRRTSPDKPRRPARNAAVEESRDIMAKVTMVEAITMAMAYEMEHDPSVVVLGEDVGVNGGVFRATAGLQQRFGKLRVMDTPLAEALIAGMSIGMAAQGMKPVAEIQFSGFIYPTVDQMINHAGRLRTRTRGRLHVPMVLRAPSGGGIHAPEHHSESK